jgi:uncharacterized Zn-finger protein
MIKNKEFFQNKPAAEIISVAADADQVSCDGGGGALGHPIVWYAFDGASSVTCGYCDRIFVKKTG